MTTQLLNTLFRVAVPKRLFVCFLFVLFGHSLAANAISPTPQQIEMFKQMPVAERNRLAKQFGVDPGGVTGKTTAVPVETIETVKPRKAVDVKEADIQDNANSQTVIVEEKTEQAPQPLKQYGYDLFAGTPTTFAPATDIPVSSDYVVGPGDSIIVQLYGKDNATHELSVNREGVIAFPQLGPMNVSGMMFSELKIHVKNSIAQQMIGVKATVTMGALRSIRIFVLGEAYRPGSYTVSALSTMTNALFSSGGITKVGSLRHIQLKRQGKLVGKFDLYDLLLRGDTSKDQRLLPGDVIFVPPIGQTVGVTGEVKRPAIYELKAHANESQEPSNTVDDLVQLAGGFLPTAYPAASRIERIGDKGIRTILNVDLTKLSGTNAKVRDADVIQVYSVLDTVENTVVLKGHVKRPGSFAWKKGLRVSDLLPSIHSLLPNPDLDYAIIKREKQPNRDIEIIKVNLGRAIQKPRSAGNVELKARDTLWIFDLSGQRTDVIGAINTQLEFQAKQGNYANTARVTGNVYIPGEYPVYKGMTLRGLLQAARLFKPETDLNKAALIHKESQNGKLSVEFISLADESLNRLVSSKDELIIFHMQQNRAIALEGIVSQLRQQADKESELKIVNVSGYVTSPGIYPLVPAMTVRDLIDFAGGFKEQAFGLGAEVTRLKIDENQFQVFERLALDLTVEADGMNTQLVSRDQLYIKRIPNWNERETVSINGEVNFPGVYPIYKGDTLSKLVSRAGGLTEYAEPHAAIFLRDSLKRREQEQLQSFKRQLERDVAEFKLEAAQGASEKNPSEVLGGTLLSQLADAKAMGRLVIDLPRILEHNEDTRTSVILNVELKDKDQLFIPPKNLEVSVLGEIQFPTSHLHDKNSDVFDYIAISGGYSSRADDSRIYVIRANGQVAAVKNGWFVRRNTEVGPGDTVVVPYDIYSASPMVYWGGVSQILFQLATTVAALNTVGVF